MHRLGEMRNAFDEVSPQILRSAAVRSSATLILFSMVSRELSFREDDGRCVRGATLM